MNLRLILILIALLGIAQSALCQTARWRFTIPATRDGTAGQGTLWRIETTRP